MTPVVVYRVFPGAVAEVEQVVPVALIFLLSHGYQVISEYLDLGISATPQDYDAGNIVVGILKAIRVELQLLHLNLSFLKQAHLS